jgi:hypothetical protein
LQTVYEWAVANQNSFWGRHDLANATYMPHTGWAGRWALDNWDHIAFTNEKIYRILEKFDVAAIIKTWKDRGWLDTDKRGSTKQVRINREKTYCYCIKRSALKEVLKLRD